LASLEQESLAKLVR